MLIAIEPGEDANDLTEPPELIDALDYVDSIVLDGATDGGVDAEEDADYLDRLRDELQLSAPRPILPHDFEVLARRVSLVWAGPSRSTATTRCDSTYNNERMITLVGIDEDGDRAHEPDRRTRSRNCSRASAK